MSAAVSCTVRPYAQLSVFSQHSEDEVMLATLAIFSADSLAEIERDSSKRTFQSFSARYPNPYKQSNSTNPLYYSFDFGGKPTPLSMALLTSAPLRHHCSYGRVAGAPYHVHAWIAARDEARVMQQNVVTPSCHCITREAICYLCSFILCMQVHTMSR